MLTLKKLLALLTPPERKRAGMLMGMILMMAFLDMLGVASILPFMAVLVNPELVQTNALLNAVFTISRYIGIHTTEQFLFALGVLVFLLLITSLSFKALTTYAQTRFALMREYSIGKRLVEGYLHQPYSWFLNRHSADLGKTILSEVSVVVSGCMMPAMTLVSQASVLSALLILLLIVSPLLSLTVGTLLITIYFLFYVSLRKLVTKAGEDRWGANKKAFQAVIEAFSAIKEIKVGGLEVAFLNRYSAPAGLQAKAQSLEQMAYQLPRYAIESIAFAGMLFFILYQMKRGVDLTETLPVIALYALAGYRMMPAFQSVYAALTQLRFAGPAVDKLYEDLFSIPDKALNKAKSKISCEESIKLNDVTFSYPNASRPVLNSIDLSIPAKTTVGFVGATGSGKTTTVDVILGLLEPQEGALKIDGQPITAANRRQWQRAIGYVPQHIYLADDSVAANIAFGVNAKDIDLKAVERAAQIANLHEFVVNDLPLGYETTVGERGVRLSGGQRQRIGIARALYHNPQVLILDEATSALDNLTEQAVMEAVNNLGHDITIILIAHRLSTVRQCDQIYLLERGEVKGQGTFDELTQANERFRAMAASH